MASSNREIYAPRRAPVVLAAPDKFRGSLTAAEVAQAIAIGARRAGWVCSKLPLADGGDGTLDAFGGATRKSDVVGPNGESVTADWRLEDGLAVIEMARASGLALAGGSADNDPMRATSRGTGELLAAAIEAGAREIILGLGGSATTDGGAGAMEALRHLLPLAVPIRVACDVRTTFVDAADQFAPQKGATPREVAALRARLVALATDYQRELGVDVAALPGGGAAGGLAGGLAALGATLESGFELVAESVDFERKLAHAQLVVTGEGLIDRTSFSGKVLGEVISRAAMHGVPVLAIAGDVRDETDARIDRASISLIRRFGAERAWLDTSQCIVDIVEHELKRFEQPA
jgi:glycerate kinase